MQNEYQIRIEKYEAILKKDNYIFNIIGYVKLFFVLTIGLLTYLVFAKNFPSYLIALLAVLLVILVILWVYHSGLFDRINYFRGIISICNRQLDRITGKWTFFEDVGTEFIDNEHSYSSDLDVVGIKSLFQFLNTTKTWHGRQVFANDLLHPEYECGELIKRQKAIAELSVDIDFSIKILYHLSQIGVDSSASDLVSQLKDKTPFIKNNVIKFLLVYIPTLTLIFIVGTVVFQQKNLYPVGAIITVLQTLIWIIGSLKTHKYIGTMMRLPYKLNAYKKVIDILLSKDFSSDKLKIIKTRLETASKAIRDLAKIEAKVSIRSNGIIYFILNVILLWDYECAILLDEWKKKYANLAEPWFTTIGEFESLLCFSHLPNICDKTCLPAIIEQDHVIDAADIGHPLLPNNARISNDFYFNNRILIISGSNMSGKTTFLRTVGVNLVLARSGSFVCAKQMSCSLLEPVASMRISDDLSEGVSTFYAELKRVKRILDIAQENNNMIFLIDEIFKGTNSVDRLTGAKTVISKLNDLGVVGMISTHDLELCDLEAIYGRISNYNFSEYYENGKIFFNYKLKPGKSHTTNANYLMEMLGIT